MIDIQALGKECRELADEGKRLNHGEAVLFARSLRCGDSEQCERLIKTLKQRAKHEER